MRISKVYHKDGSLIQVESGLPLTWRIAMVVLAAASAVFACGVYHANPGGLKHFMPGAIAGMALAMGLGRFVYTIRAHAHVYFRLFLFGIPVMSQLVRASSFHTMKIKEDRDGTVTLRFLDASGHPRLTLSGFPTPELAERVGGLFRMDGEKQSEAIRSFVQESVAEERWFPRWVALLLVAAVFCVMPGLAWMMGFTMEELGHPMTAGVILTLLSTYTMKRESGIMAVDKDHSYMDRWTRHGWFRILEYRQHLGEQAGQQLLRLRWDHGLWAMPLLAIAQAACVFLACHYNTPQVEAPATPHPATPEFRDSEAVRQGAERFQQLRKQRDHQE